MQDLATKLFAKDSWQTPRNARTLRAYMALQNREIGERIAGLRHARGNPPQEIVAHKLGVANRSYQSWEAGDTKPSWRNLSKLANFYGVTEEWILIGESAAEPPVVEQPTLADVLAAVRQLEDQLQALRLETASRAAGVIQHIDETLRSIAEAQTRQRRRA